jgi:HEPN domain-containing protein
MGQRCQGVGMAAVTRFQALRQQRHAQWLTELKQRIDQLLTSSPPGGTVRTDQIYLFGSRERGDWDGISDTDLLVLAESRTAAEQSLKAALLELGIDPPHTHLLHDLVKQFEEAGLATHALEALPLRGLSRMAIQSRYPMNTSPPADLFDPGDADQALTIANRVLELVEALDS